MAQRLYLVVEPVAPVAEDLAQCIGEFDAGARVLRTASAEEALQALADHDVVVAAFVHDDPQGFAASALGLRLEDRGALVVFMGRSADQAPAALFQLLPSPFDAETIRTLLDNLLSWPEQLQAPSATRGA